MDVYFIDCSISNLFFNCLIHKGMGYGDDGKENDTYSKLEVISLSDYDNFEPAELKGKEYEKRRSESKVCSLH